MRTQTELAERFQDLHRPGNSFIIPNPWDAGTAHVLEKMGFEALATTSAGMAFAAGKRDNMVAREDVLAHCRALVAAVDVPVSADLGNCFGDDPATVAETMRLAAETGIAGASVEDMKGDYSIYNIGLATERVHAAAAAVHRLPFPFVLTARAENFLVSRRDLADTIARLQAYQEADADVLYAPGLTTRDEIAAVLSEIDRPLNVIAGIAGISLTFDELRDLGVTRISVGSTLARAALTTFVRAAREMREQGTFSFGEDAMTFREINTLFDA